MITAEKREALRIVGVVLFWLVVGSSIYAVYHALFVLK